MRRNTSNISRSDDYDSGGGPSSFHTSRMARQKSEDSIYDSWASSGGDRGDRGEDSSKDDMSLSLETLPTCLQESRHYVDLLTGRGGLNDEDEIIKNENSNDNSNWRMKERTKTSIVGLVLCLNIGTDPPDVIKTSPCAREECWIVPGKDMSATKALEAVGKNLQNQYEKVHSRVKYKLCLDPVIESVMKLCHSLRRNARNERVLLHYNGHGVPRPTVNGELWVFNVKLTQYMPLSIMDVMQWVGRPAIFVFDCSASGVLLPFIMKGNAEGGKDDYAATSAAMAGDDFEAAETAQTPIPGGGGEEDEPESDSMQSKECFVLTACAANEILPMNPDYPADLFTACLTTPISMALRWFVLKNPMSVPNINHIEIAKRIPGQVNDRKTPLGELNWIFTSITDTIAWNVLPPHLFQKLYRQDTLVSSLFRGFLLAERIMRSLNCTPQSIPELPPTFQHPLWNAWDLAVELLLSKIPEISSTGLESSRSLEQMSFLQDQLTAFEVWLQFGSKKKKPPLQLPIVLQVLLSQAHRVRALSLLTKFLDLGPWSVSLALSVGIFPYVLKLLQSPTAEVRELLIIVWTKILAFDPSCKSDLVKNNGPLYFVKHLHESSDANKRCMASFILCKIMENDHAGQVACLNQSLHQILASILMDPSSLQPNLKRWICLCVTQLCHNFEEGKQMVMQTNLPSKLLMLQYDNVPEVRTAVALTFGTMISISDGHSYTVDKKSKVSSAFTKEDNTDNSIIQALCDMIRDASTLVRIEVTRALSTFVLLPLKLPSFIEIAGSHLRKNIEKSGSENSSAASSTLSSPSKSRSNTIPVETKVRVWDCLKIVQATEPHPAIRDIAVKVIRYVNTLVLEKKRDHGETESEAKIPIVATVPANFKRSSSSISVQKLEQKQVGSTMFSPSSSLMRSHMNKSLDAEGFHKNNIVMEGKEGEEEKDKSKDENIQLIKELKSTFYDWSCKFFSLPFLDLEINNPIDDPLSEVGAAALYRQRRYHDTLSDSAKLQEGRKLEQTAIIETKSEMISLIIFHPYNPHVVIADEKDGITYWGYEDGKQVTSFRNGNKGGSRLTALTWINDHDEPLLLTGSDEGQIRVWRDASKHERRLCTTFTAIPELLPGTRGSGLVLEWHQDSTTLFTTGNSSTVQSWDMSTEKPSGMFSTGTPSCVTAVATHRSSLSGKVLLAGCGDGSLKFFDIRASNEGIPIGVSNEHNSWVVNVNVQAGNSHEIVSGSVSGDVRFWDLRSGKSYKQLEAHKNPMTALALHNFAPILATGSHNQFLKTFNTTSMDPINVIKFHDGFYGQRIGPISCIAFHPYKLILAAGATDSIASIYKPS